MSDAEETAGRRDRLAAQLAKIEVLIHNSSCYSGDFADWRRETEALLEMIYGRDSRPCQDFQAVMFTPLFLSCRDGDAVFAEAYRQGLADARVLLNSCLSRQ